MPATLKTELKRALEDACTAQSLQAISRGRTAIFAMPRESVLEIIESVASESLSLNKEWEYRRLLEVYDQLDKNLLRCLIEAGLASTNAEVREAANDFLAHDDFA
jgi:hypothetical protein